MTVETTRGTSIASPDSRKLEYRIYSDLSEIMGISHQWDCLLAASRFNRAFGSWEWYLASCRIQTSLVPYLVIGTLGSDMTCILPLAIDPRNCVATFPHLENDYNDILVRGDDPAQAASLLKYAMSRENTCRRMILSKLKPDSNCAQAAVLLDSSSNIVCHARDTKLYRYIKLPSTFDDYLASRGKLFRRNIRRALRNDGRGGLVIRELCPADFNPFELPEVFIQLILDRHDDKCVFRHTHAQSFAREVLPAVFRKGGMRVFAIFEKERIIAIDLYLDAANGLVAWNGGFLAEMERWSPGTALIAFAVRQAIASGLHELDFGEGDEAYKESWSNSSYLVRELSFTAT
jgi:CelD/BcsL family acetyltransferase involved in cellulose biosynthesis